MQNAHINSYRNKAISPAIQFGGPARHLTASAVNPTNYYTHITHPPLNSGIISIILHSTVSAIVSVGLSLLCPLARCLSVPSRAFFVVASGFARCMLSLLNYMGGCPSPSVAPNLLSFYRMDDDPCLSDFRTLRELVRHKNLTLRQEIDTIKFCLCTRLKAV